MKDRWCQQWFSQAMLLSSMSPCPRGRVGAFVIDNRNNPISAGFNGPPRGSRGSQCGGTVCDRTDQGIKSGTQTEVGCHHAEQNALMNAVNKGVSVAGCTLVITTSPCLACARLIHHAGILRVICQRSESYTRGIRYLLENKVEVKLFDPCQAQES